MSNFAVIVLTSVRGGKLNDVVNEVDTLDEALENLKELEKHLGREWLAITIVHIEDYPAMMDGANRKGEITI